MRKNQLSVAEPMEQFFSGKWLIFAHLTMKLLPTTVKFLETDQERLYSERNTNGNGKR